MFIDMYFRTTLAGKNEENDDFAYLEKKLLLRKRLALKLCNK
jgi:hypothetical protein